MKSFVLDCSIAMSWCFEDESSEYADKILDYINDNPYEIEANVPLIWMLEVINVLHISERKKRITEARSLHFLDFVENLPIREQTQFNDPKDILMIARSYQLSSYDASYLLLALQANIPLATLDAKLQEAARKANIPLLFLD